MIAIFQALLPVFGLIALGMVLDRARIMPPGTAVVLNQWVFRLSLPSLIFVSFAQKTPEQLLRIGYMAGVLGGMVLAFLLVHLLFRLLFRHAHVECGIWALLATFPNTSFLGLPILAAIFPENSDAVLASAISTVLCLPFLMLVTVLLEYKKTCAQCADAGAAALKKVGASLAGNPILLATILGAAACVSRVPMPRPLLVLLNLISVTTTPCSLVAIGIVLSVQLAFRGVSSGTSLTRLTGVNLVKLVLQPALTYALLFIMGVRGTWLAMGVILAAMPTATIVYIISENYETYMRESSLTLLTNTVLSVLTIPLTIVVLEYYHVF